MEASMHSEGSRSQNLRTNPSHLCIWAFMLIAFIFRTGNLRLRLPVENIPYTGTHNATRFGLACTQVKEPVVPDDLSPDAKAVVNGYLGSLDFDSGEDCK